MNAKVELLNQKVDGLSITLAPIAAALTPNYEIYGAVGHIGS